MNELTALTPGQTGAALAQLSDLNELTEAQGVFLSAEQLRMLVQARSQALLDAGRVEFGEGVLRKLAYAFCDSPFVTQYNYAQTLEELQEVFYALKNECRDALSDDELIAAMEALYNGEAGGSAALTADRLTERFRQARA